MSRLGLDRSIGRTRSASVADEGFNGWVDTDTDLPGLILGILTEGEKKSVEKEEIRWVTHRM